MIYRMCLFCTQGAYQSWCAPVQRKPDERYQTGVTASSPAEDDCAYHEIVSVFPDAGGRPFAVGIALV
jgi:hypothetical protein